jgi:hypothetical protein
MLRVSYSETPAGQRWQLCGRLAGSWVDELRSFWRYTRQHAHNARAVFDLTDVTFIDESGEELLSEFQSAGGEFVASGVENKDLLATLKDHGRRPLRRLICGHTRNGGNSC